MVFIDSGSDANFIDINLVESLSLSRETLQKPMSVYSLNNQLLHQVSKITVPIIMSIVNYQEMIMFHVIDSPQQHLVLHTQWLQTHNPQVKWPMGRIVGWNTHFLANCLRSAPPQPLSGATRRNTDLI